ncbi:MULTISPECIES: DNA replication/repair protein RecF [Aliiglaciecola]|uniref:DNA replication/repair protein RecF n=1 Tax=Aliiglaciecola TaxID=1406885 RepID=UPI001C097631|nr:MULTISPECIES: DNA replication/repair protein RecF [Aliiglaciecola]MBU2876494.1 DNA replication/repair protein RecF [Aliiglaciecola lipolytica]MDO6713044.1 DNA replication/repair protein RecF [Aliiglaciecola sp. 2_MG-2023]MDO6754083.1 DNA replication/repair protein RecF [Aliiglaciecola sp. 1_MG-2023]
MKLDKVQIQHFRNLQNVDISPSSSLNFIFGQNGSGKSSFLEALHYLGFGRSFRTLKHKNVIQYDSTEFSVFCVVSDSNHSLKLGMSRKNDDSLLVSVNGNKSNKMSELVSHVPIQIFTPQSSDLIIGSPSLRRRFLDWGLFHVEPSFIQTSQDYQKLVKQKNALLRKIGLNSNNENSTQMQFWDKQIIKVGNHLTELRKGYLDSILEHINSNLMQFLPEFSVEISYHRGWEKDASLEESIKRKFEKDCRNGYLSVGPHKADLKLKCNGVEVSETLSRGQLRMLVAALQLAQIQHLSGKTKKSCVFLLDDVGAELDETKRESFIDKLLENETQLFITAIEKSQLLFIEKYKNKKMFHVEHGHMREEN